jgi:hypothetical protein
MMFIRKYCGCILKKTNYNIGNTLISCGRPSHGGLQIFLLNGVDSKPIKKKDFSPKEAGKIMSKLLLNKGVI